MKGTAFITGATSGFGDAIARRLSLDGYKIIALGRRKERLEKLAGELGNTHIIAADIRDKKAVFDAVKNLPENFKDIEVLVNNAGLALGQEKTIDASIEDFETMVDTNIKGLLYSTKAVLPIMTQRKSGYIFNLGSVAGHWPYPGGNVYGGTKAFVKQFSYNLRNDLLGTGIRVTEIAPGLCKTEFSEVRFKGDKAKADSIYANTQFITADDIATMVLNCLNLPKSVNVNLLEVMATTQTWAGFYFERD
ncbi:MULTISPECIES: SDR family NAD(P)-dependent oxidoreductase [Campylobacter]|jgi:oxidoreductase, short chain dehydrogenase/reductase family|uniref:Short-chain dehydrogenase/reductase, subgroup 5 n=1 Tax=Campylobacter curvus (strain 525.92) TaxID=360105 RepID=A7GY38_CAMC5|nr:MULTISPECIES: SDR family NAD(P)-dependent oxidoreductase [Campylobacter]EAU00476.1 short-chain dehydrogenase/reductase, subgroup 5 [Campylobacter curvus 525.92]EJP76281.1 NADP-dependent L-serine/L-allo-threonine dehydrogenase YdfG [Campylobacter sp. FOBRC14]